MVGAGGFSGDEQWTGYEDMDLIGPFTVSPEYAADAGTVTRKKEDTQPRFVVQLLDGNGDPLDLSLATAVRMLVSASVDDLVLEGECDIVDVRNGWVEYRPGFSEIDEAGGYIVEWEVTFEDGDVLTAPQLTYQKLSLVSDLD